MPKMADPGTRELQTSKISVVHPPRTTNLMTIQQAEDSGNTIKSVKDVVNRGAKAAESMLNEGRI